MNFIRRLRLPVSKEEEANKHEKIGKLSRELGKTKKAEISLTKALKIREKMHGDSHEAVAAVLQELGMLKDELGDYDEAIKYFVRAGEIRQVCFGGQSTEVAATLYNIGTTLQKKGDFDGAAKCFNESYDVQRMMIGEGQDSIEMSDSLIMLGFVKFRQGEIDEAKTLLEQALTIRKVHLDNIKNISETLKHTGEVYKRIYGDNHEAVAAVLQELGMLKDELGDYDEAI